MRETQVQSLGQEVPLEKETATQSSILDWRIPWTQQPGRGFFFFFDVHEVSKSQTGAAARV